MPQCPLLEMPAIFRGCPSRMGSLIMTPVKPRIVGKFLHVGCAVTKRHLFSFKVESKSPCVLRCRAKKGGPKSDERAFSFCSFLKSRVSSSADAFILFKRRYLHHEALVATTHHLNTTQRSSFSYIFPKSQEPHNHFNRNQLKNHASRHPQLRRPSCQRK